MRSAWLPVGLVLLGAVGGPLACGLPFEAPAGSGGGSTTAGTGGTGSGATATTSTSSSSSSSSTTTTSSSSSGTGGKTCASAHDCGTSTLCGKFTCDGGVCGLQQLQGDGPLFSQIYGDCHAVTCEKGLLVTAEDNKDKYDDGNDCTTNECTNGVATNPVKAGAACGVTNQCTTAGACVQCLEDGDCADPTPKCMGNRCVVQPCADGQMTSGETDVDCGGLLCAACDDGKRCDLQSDCVSGICSVKTGETLKTCHHDCADGAKNGNETGPDCGGPTCAMRCGAGKGCVAGGDCKSGVCKLGVCLDPACNDGVKNGNETGIDCGTACPTKACPGG
jgi:hypothetical protein